LSARKPKQSTALIDQQPLVITKSGEAMAVLQDVIWFEKNQDTMALLKILALGNVQIAKKQVTPAAIAFAKVRRLKHLQKP
jgi:PHD/YefM family antitoxin component YafN of YafNO toxin-antitoxin module